jgi:cytochrome c
MMNSWTFNKISGAVLGTALMVLGLQNLSAGLFHVEHPAADKQGFLIEAAAAEEAAPAAGAAPEAAMSLGALLAAADPVKGETVGKACAACHNFQKGGANKVGPALYDVVERPIGAAPGYAYSEGFKAKAGEKWSYDNLYVYLKAPKKYIAGTKMAFGGIGNDKKRADLVAYLGTLSDAKKPFPAP